MLVLGRRVGESVMIGDDIVVTVVGIEGDRIRIGIQAPAQTRILRRELYESVRAENLRAASLPPGDGAKWLPSLRRILQEERDQTGEQALAPTEGDER